MLRSAIAMTALLGLACAPGSGPPALLASVPHGDVHDGTIADMALPSDASVQPELARGWIAQGRVRAAIRLSDGERMNAESEEFSSVTGEPEQLLALELDESAACLYTLTQNALYREDLAGPCLSGPCTSSPCTPANPGNRTAFVLAPAASSVLDPPLAPGERLLDIKLIPRAPGGSSAVRVLLLTSERLVILSSDSAGLAFQGQCLELYERLNGAGSHFLVSSSDPHFDSLEVDRFVSAHVAVDDTGRTIAYLFANIGAYGHDVHGSAPLLLLCDLDAVSDFLHPTLDADLFPAMNFAYWNPFEADPPFTGSDPEGIHENSARALAIRVDEHQTELYVACGRQKQLRCLTAIFEPGGIQARSTITLDTNQDLEVVQLAVDSSQRLFVRGTDSLFDIDISTANPTWLQLDHQPFVEGAVGDSAQVLMASGSGTARTLWTMGAGYLGFNVQAFDVGLEGPSPFMELEYIWHCDGGVALDFENTYVLTGGGVRHYRWNGAAWEQGRYRPAQDSHSGADHAQGFSEQLELAQVEPGNARLLGPSNTGEASGLFDWSLDAAQDPQAGSFYPLVASAIFPGWIEGDQLYTDDVAFLTEGGESYAALCPTRQPGVPGGAREAALVLYRWNSGAWTQCASAHAELGAGLANTIALADLSTGGKVAFLATDAGLLSFTLRELGSGAPTVQLASTISAEMTDGIAPIDARLVVAYTHGVDPRYVVYDWDRSSGAISPAGSTTLTRSQLGVPAGFGRTYRLRFDPLAANDGYLYDSNDGGVFRLRCIGAGAGSIHCDASWTSVDKGLIQDCRVYSFGGQKRLLVTKDQEAFAWVDP